MSVVCVDVTDRDERASVERECIRLLSNYAREPADRPSKDWLGHHADRKAVRRSGLWNVRQVDMLTSRG